MVRSELYQRMGSYLTQSTKALIIGGMIKSGHPLLPLQALAKYGIKVQEVDTEKAFFGFRIPYLPISVNSNDLIGENTQKFSEAISKQVGLLANMGKWIGTAFSLRYLYSPENRSIEIFLIGRVVSSPGNTQALVIEVASDISNRLRSSGLQPELITNDQILKILNPIQSPIFLELWQHEHFAEINEPAEYGSIESHEVAVICPFRQPDRATWYELFEAMVVQEYPVTINIHLEPTVLFDFEAQLLEGAAIIADKCVEYEVRRNTGTKRVFDPIAQVVSQSLTDLYSRLTGSNNPVLLTVQVCSSNAMSALSVAKELQTVLSIDTRFDEAIQNKRLPAGCDIVAPDSSKDITAATRTLSELDLFPLSASQIDTHGRLRYLMDIKTASAAFRLPVVLSKGLPGVITKSVIQSYDPGQQITTKDDKQIYLGKYSDRGGSVHIDFEKVGRHILVAGTTQSGKTVTCLQILSELWAKKIPFLVIEPVKSHYRGLLKDNNFENIIQVFTPGDDAISPFRLNPFHLIQGISVESHVAKLRDILVSALPTFGVLPALIQEAIYNIYQYHEWQLTDRVKENDVRSFPTLGEFYTEIISVSLQKGWSNSTTQDMVGAAAARVGSLLMGTIGATFNSQSSIPIDTIFDTPTVIELEHLEDEDKSLVMLFLLMFLREYTKTTRFSNKLSHVTLIEEAHLVMHAQEHKAGREILSDASATSAEAVSNLLSEIASSGEGIIIAEQIPTRLIEDALKNTNTKIIHRLPDGRDREIIGKTMNASSQQWENFGKLDNGKAAFFTTGMDAPAIITIPHYTKDNNIPDKLPDKDVEARPNKWRSQFVTTLLPFRGCKHCQTKCEFRMRVMRKAYSLSSFQGFQDFIDSYYEKGSEGANWLSIVQTAREQLKPLRLGNDLNAIYCFLVQLTNCEFTDKDRERVERALAFYKGGN